MLVSYLYEFLPMYNKANFSLHCIGLILWCAIRSFSDQVSENSNNCLRHTIDFSVGQIHCVSLLDTARRKADCEYRLYLPARNVFYEIG